MGAIDHDLIQLVVLVLYLTGLRISECLSLTTDTVDLDQKVIHVVAGKGNKDRLIPISDKLLPLLQHYLEHERPDTDSNLFFCTKKTGKLSDVYVNRVLADAVKKLGWKKKVTAHILRHSFASQLVKKDVNLVDPKAPWTLFAQGNKHLYSQQPRAAECGSQLLVAHGLDDRFL